MIIILGGLSYIFSLAVPAVAFVVALIMRRKWLKCLAISIVSYLIAVCTVCNVFPLYLGETVRPFEYEWMWLGFIAPPFYGMPFSLESVLNVMVLYWQAAVYGLLLGFLVTLCFKPFRKIIPAVIFAVSTLAVSVLSLILPDIILGGLNKMYDTSDTVMTFIFYAIGYIAAVAVIKLVPSITEHFDGKRPKREKVDDGENIKIRRKNVEISDRL